MPHYLDGLGEVAVGVGGAHFFAFARTRAPARLSFSFVPVRLRAHGTGSGLPLLCSTRARRRRRCASLGWQQHRAIKTKPTSPSPLFNPRSSAVRPPRCTVQGFASLPTRGRGSPERQSSLNWFEFYRKLNKRLETYSITYCIISGFYCLGSSLRYCFLMSATHHHHDHEHDHDHAYHDHHA